MSDKQQYRSVKVEGKDVEKVCNDLGGDGWDVFSICASTSALFPGEYRITAKRKVEKIDA